MAQAKLATTLPKAYKSFQSILDKVSRELSKDRSIDFTGGPVSISDLIAYQIGWGLLVINWYETGSRGDMPEMPCKDFSWDYTALAQHFYKSYEHKSLDKLRSEFDRVVQRILEIVDESHAQGRLETEGHWEWCTLKSGKQWPLAKWIQINTVAPYGRAVKIIRAFLKEQGAL